MVFERLQEIISEQLGIEKSEISLNSNIIDDIGADSLDMVEMLMNVEKEWDIVIDDSEISDIETMQDVVDFVEAKIKQK